MARTQTTLRSRLSQLGKFVAPMLLLLASGVSGCDKHHEEAERRYCDQSGCFACVGDRCYPVAGDPAKPTPDPVATTCDTDSACGLNNVCNLGRCEAACKDNSACRTGNICISGRCRPSDAAQCGVGNALCSTDSDCGASARCVGRACASDCAASKCALGQVCQAGSCIEDPSPAKSACTFDADCGTAGSFRCINAYCLPTCSDNSKCTDGAVCQKGVCRGNRKGA